VRTLAARLRAALPWACAVAILWLVFRRVSFHDLRGALSQVPLLPFVALVVGTNSLALFLDSVATAFAFKRLKTPVPFGEVLAIRGATYVLSLINYGVGAGGIVYFVARAKRASAVRTTGVVLYVMASTIGALALLAAPAVVHGNDPALVWFRRALVALVAGTAVYAGLLLGRPAFLAKRALLEPLFDGGVGGQALGVLVRVPHLAALLIGHFLCLRLFGVQVPPLVALAYLPLAFLTTAIPITPQGLGTMQLVTQHFFVPYGPPGTALAAVTAYSLCFQVASMTAQALLGLYFLRRTASLMRAAEAAAPAALG
jgi:uncharacterized membrane protein YbhN (UPF0104 family)